MEMSYLRATCWRCGVTNETRDPRGYLCQTCKHMLDIRPTEKDALEPGTWVLRGAVAVWRKAPDLEAARAHQEATILQILSKKLSRKAA